MFERPEQDERYTVLDVEWVMDNVENSGDFVFLTVRTARYN